MSGKPDVMKLADRMDRILPPPDEDRWAAAALIRQQHAAIAALTEALEWTARALDKEHPAAIKARATLSEHGAKP